MSIQMLGSVELNSSFLDCGCRIEADEGGVGGCVSPPVLPSLSYRVNVLKVEIYD